jgi:hypothetical protein
MAGEAPRRQSSYLTENNGDKRNPNSPTSAQDRPLLGRLVAKAVISPVPKSRHLRPLLAARFPDPFALETVRAICIDSSLLTPRAILILVTETPSTRASMSQSQKKSSHRETSSPSSRTADFPATFFALKRVLAPYEKYLHVNTDTRDRYYLETRSPSYKGKPLFFGAVVSGRAYVSFHLMPLYWDPSLREKISPQLKKRMQGKSCFNFTAPDPALFRELAKLSATGLALYRSKNLL